MDSASMLSSAAQVYPLGLIRKAYFIDFMAIFSGVFKTLLAHGGKVYPGEIFPGSYLSHTLCFFSLFKILSRNVNPLLFFNTYKL